MKTKPCACIAGMEASRFYKAVGRFRAAKLSAQQLAKRVLGLFGEIGWIVVLNDRNALCRDPSFEIEAFGIGLVAPVFVGGAILGRQSVEPFGIAFKEECAHRSVLAPQH